MATSYGHNLVASSYFDAWLRVTGLPEWTTKLTDTLKERLAER
jgi:hypothetical protein